jgi:catechol 2,3-dioxygenase-like lactoylglutathione lyase family enzyme
MLNKVTAPDLLAYHVGFVVRDLESVADRYQRMLGVDRWRIHDLEVAKIPWDPRSTDARLHIGFGRGAGMTFELIQPLQGRTPHLDFLEQHGEGVQHIGLWTADVQAAVQNAVEQGGRVTLARYDPNNMAVVQLTPGSSVEQIVQSIDRDRIAYIDPGVGGVQLEFVGPAGGAGLRAWMEQDFAQIIQPAPPWSQT